MARLNTNRLQDPLVKLHNHLKGMVSAGSSTLSVSTESIDHIVAGKELTQGASNEIGQLTASLESIFKSELQTGESPEGKKLGLTDGISSEQTVAAGIVAAALSSDATARAYQQAALRVSVEDNGGEIQVIQPSLNPAFAYSTDNVSLEAFDNRQLEGLRAYNLLYAFSAAVQDEFGELAFRTVTLTPDNAGLEVSIRRTVIMEEYRHALTGEFIRWEPRNLLDAVTDPTIIINNTTKIYPRVIIGDAKNEALFTDKAKIAPVKITANNGALIDTAPLRPGKTIDLVGISHNDKIPGQSDQTDSLDQAISVTKVYYEVETSAGKSIIAVNTAGLDTANFLKSNQGLDRQVSLDFNFRDFVVTGQTLDITGVPAVALGFLTTAPNDDKQIRLEALITGTANLQRGNIQVNSGPAEIAEVRQIDPVDGSYEVVRDEATLDALRAEFLSVTMIGYEVKASRSNLNKRQMGLLIDSIEERVRYVVPLSPPISVQTPITDTATATELAGPLNAQRLVNSINAVTKILEVRDTLRAVIPNISYGSPTDEATRIEGFARLMVRPFLFEDTVNVADILTNTASAHRTRDTMAVLVNRIRFAVARAYTESRYQPALDAVNGTPGQRPTVMIGTDPLTASYLAVEGDWRTLIGFDAKVVVSYDYRMRNKIFATFVRPGVADVDVMSFGAMAYIPELVTNAVMNYNGTTTNVTQVQNRTLHVCFLPIMIWLDVEGLEEAASLKSEFAVSL